MNEQQIATLTFFRYRSWEDRWWAFRQMGLAPEALTGTPGLEFFKLLGSGGGNGFSIFPNFGTYGLLGVWEEASFAQRFFEQNDHFQNFLRHSEEHWTVFLRNAMAHGSWDGQTPFRASVTFNPEEVVAVITRATIHTRHLWKFWRFTPPVSRSIEKKEGLLFSVGIGEVPIVQQATFSLWQNSHLMKAFAYKSRRHREVVRRTRELGWYKEELFARFHPYSTTGSWMGKDPLAVDL